MTQITYIKSKVHTWDSLSRCLHIWRFLDKKIVFTNGCFDILHPGHVEYLAGAADLGDILIIGLNSDHSVSKIKGPHRPINPEKDRISLLTALHFVDAVIVFDDLTPEKLIQQIRPDVLVKGGDYKPVDIAGYAFVTAAGGSVLTIPMVEGYSSSAIEKKIRAIQKS